MHPDGGSAGSARHHPSGEREHGVAEKLERSVNTLQKQNKALSSQLATTNANLATTVTDLTATTTGLNTLKGCMRWVKLTRYGSSFGKFGYLWSTADPSIDPTALQFPTTALDGTIGSDPFTAFLTLTSSCVTAPAGVSAGRSARAFGTMLPSDSIATVEQKTAAR